MENLFITATEARELTATSWVFKKHIYKGIKEQAIEGYNELTWGIHGIDSDVLLGVVQDLRHDGYEVAVEEDEYGPQELKIKW